MPLEKAQVYQNVVMKLSVLRFMVKALSKQGKTDLNRQCESFFATVLNHVDGTNLKNLNEKDLNVASIDLADDTRRLCVQVTATADSSKIKETIATFISHQLYKTYDQLQFLMLVDKKSYTTKFSTGGHFAFDHKLHVRDIDDVLAAAEALDLADLQKLSDFVDAQLPSVSKALAPGSLLATAEKVDGKPPTTAHRYLLYSVDDEGGSEWKKDFATLLELHANLKSLSRKQREVVAYVCIHGSEGSWRRVSMPIQTLQQRLGLGEQEMFSYFDALKKAHLMDVDDDEEATDFELTCRLDGSHNDAFTMLKGFLKSEADIERLLVDCDFGMLD